MRRDQWKPGDFHHQIPKGYGTGVQYSRRGDPAFVSLWEVMPYMRKL